jgi:hypothetical protein
LVSEIVKRGAKSVSLDLAKLTHRVGSERLPAFLIASLKIGYSKKHCSGLASCCISIDFDHFTHSGEAADSGRWLPLALKNQLIENSEGTRILVDLAEKYSIPMTWAICGKTAMEDMDSYETIVKSRIKHEIAIHTFSHLDVSKCSEEELRREVSQCLDVIRLDRVPKTFVFPWNRQGNMRSLREMGFIAFRDRDRLIGSPKKNEAGLWSIPPVYYFDQKSMGASGVIKKFADLCVAHGAIFHLWTHPWSIVRTNDQRELVKKTLEPVFSHLRDLRDSEKLKISTMGEIASQLDERERQALVENGPGASSFSSFTALDKVVVEREGGERI